MLRETIDVWLDADGPGMAAALSYYTAFSIAPLLLISMAVVGALAPGQEESIAREMLGLIPAGGADAVRELLEALGKEQRNGVLAAIVGGMTLLIGAGAVFGQLQAALNRIWGVQSSEAGGWWSLVQRRFLSFTLVVATGFLLLVSLIATTALGVAIDLLGSRFPALVVLTSAVQLVAAIGLAALVFALVFRVVPDATVRWRDAWRGGLVAGVLFTFGQMMLSTWLANPARTSLYGSFASLLVFLIWVYYSAQLLLLGAAFTRVTSPRRQDMRQDTRENTREDTPDDTSQDRRGAHAVSATGDDLRSRRD